ncbi:MAG: Arc family DNA-binding protein [Spirochaetales bacterium]|nr:Arc family DNA-binding protein [Spirochaetales bacterium]MCF7939202.1 Arc family DNA-binding protein [Spirochaetales bacterium]
MKSIHIRNIDPQVLQRLKRRAELHHRSMQGELKAILEEAVRKMPDASREEGLDLITVSTGKTEAWRRDEYYDRES